MSALRILIGVLAAATITQIAVVRANAQENIDAYACQYIGTSTLEPLGDREGHGVNGGVKSGHWGGAKVGHLGMS
jgi:hypothetical protein